MCLCVGGKGGSVCEGEGREGVCVCVCVRGGEGVCMCVCMYACT